jgi:DNA-directed RNA polymerase subunit H (RpoH/RPB5)
MDDSGSGFPPLFQIYNVVLDMLFARCFIVPGNRRSPEEYARDFCAYDEQGRLFVQRELLTLSLVHSWEREKTVRVFFLDPLGIKTGKKQVEQLLAKLGETRTRAIFIVPFGSALTSHAVKLIDDMNRSNKSVLIECFSEEQVSVDITLIGKLDRQYRVLSEAEKQQVIAKYSDRIPKIAYDDRIARYYGMQHSDVLCLERSSESAGRYNKYSQCLYVEQLPKDSKVQKKKV